MQTIHIAPDFPLNRRMRKAIRRGKLLVVREGEERTSLGGGSDHTSALICDKCGVSIMLGAKFCPQCGDPVTEADRAQAQKGKKKNAEIKLTFGYSSSPSYERAVLICAKNPSYLKTGEGRKALHEVTLAITDVELALTIYELVGNWKTSRMLINGRSATKKNLTMGEIGCYRNRQSARDRGKYCFGEGWGSNIWGCKRLDMHFVGGRGWFSHGHMGRGGIWHVDKDKICHELKVNSQECELCPVFNLTHALNVLDGLPERINPKTDPDWEYEFEYEDMENGDYRKKKIGVMPTFRHQPSISDNAEDHPVQIIENQHIPPRESPVIQRREDNGKTWLILAVIGVIVLVVVTS